MPLAVHSHVCGKPPPPSYLAVAVSLPGGMKRQWHGHKAQGCEGRGNRGACWRGMWKLGLSGHLCCQQVRGLSLGSLAGSKQVSTEAAFLDADSQMVHLLQNQVHNEGAVSLLEGRGIEITIS